MARFAQFSGKHVNLDRVEVIEIGPSPEEDENDFMLTLRMPAYTCFEYFDTEEEAIYRLHELLTRAA